MGERLDVVRAVAEDRGLGRLRHVGIGLEFEVYRATGPAGQEVVLRVPLGARHQANVNDPRVDTRALLRWEHQVTTHLSDAGFPVARPVELVLGDVDVLVSQYVPDDGSALDPTALGKVLACLHEIPVPPGEPVAAENRSPCRLIAHRVTRRWGELRRLSPDVPPAVPEARLTALLDGRPCGSLVHLDVRRSNLRVVRGSVRAVLDWSNALVGDRALELGRVTEFARLPENGLDLAAVRTGYRAGGGDVPTPDDPALLVYQLDAAVMLALVFLSEAPDPARAPAAVRRAVHLNARLQALG